MAIDQVDTEADEEVAEVKAPIQCPTCHGTGKLLAGLDDKIVEVRVLPRRYRRCEVCGEWEDVTERRRNWRVHPACSNRARVAKHRAKKKMEAVTLEHRQTH